MAGAGWRIFGFCCSFGSGHAIELRGDETCGMDGQRAAQWRASGSLNRMCAAIGEVVDHGI